eukprot:NODE_582_length_1346_cov_128.228056_g543_i0.p1 GENE.NODE_582_length_1346_cov_128.228056_g543_i0~~NODE_582_length_1346_cov_128.228056_g543_i0.p1  ORF type:complete len:442 (-),score=64.73 NODE_582_length_1346_cov_128.228056_g543_i0:19-1293(-)
MANTTLTGHIDNILLRSGPLALPDFNPSPATKTFLHETCKVLIIGAGGLGCELLKDLALSGFRDIHVIDMDTIELSNLNRQFLFRQKDVGKPKALVAADFVMSRVPGVKVTPIFGNIKDQEDEYYRQFNIIVCGLDSIDARRWINSTVHDLVDYTVDGDIDPSTIIPIIDGGTEGFKGQARVIIPKMSACFECTLDLFPPRVTFPVCTVANTPRLPEHCIEWASTIEWPRQFPEKKVDGDDPEHIQWLFQAASARADKFHIPGVTYRLTQGVVKNIIPNIASCNAVIAAACANEAFKICTSSASYLNNYMMYTGDTGCYTYTFEYEKKENCPVCGDNHITYTVSPELTLEELIHRLAEHPSLQMKKPSIRGEGKTLYMQSPPSLEQQTRQNLHKTLSTLFPSGSKLTVTDPNLPFSVDCSVFFQ